MLVFEIVIGLLLVGVVLTVVSKRIGTPYPALLALAGAGLALVPGTPTLVLDPELALTLFVAPVLVDAAFDASPRDLRANWRSVAGLAVGAVALTIVVVAFVVRALVPGVSWPVAVALGAIVAPPDAAAATAVLKQLRPPHRLLVILEGESLFNDASALLVFRLAISTVATGALAPAKAVPMFLLVTVGSTVLGLVLSRVVIAVSIRLEEMGAAVIFQFCVAFAVWLIAERLHLSGIITLVVFSMAASRRASALTPARMRIPTYAVWEFAVFALNVLAFILSGFQLKAILERIDRPTLIEYLGVSGAVCGATILARIAWVSLASAFQRRAAKRGPRPLTRREAAVVGWCGMRGIVTLAAALALPTAGPSAPEFPHRDLILFTAFTVVLGTLVVQGITLRPLLRWLRLEDDGEVARELRLARIQTLQAGLAATEQVQEEELAVLVRRRYTLMLRHVETPNGGVAREDRAFVQQALAAERAKLLALRADGTIGDAAFQRLEQELDIEELYLTQIVRTGIED